MRVYLPICLALVGCGPAATDREPTAGGHGDGADSAGDTDLPPDTAVDTDAPEVIRTVCGDGSADYATLGDAVADAPDGAVLAVCADTWTERLVVVGRSLTVRGAGTDATVLDGGGDSQPARVSAAGALTLEALTLTNGHTSGGVGGGVSCDHASLALAGVVVRDSTAPTGGGVGAESCDVSIDTAAVLANSGWTQGGGIWIRGGTIAMTHALVEGNTGGNGGGLYVHDASGTISSSTFRGNSGDNGGGAFWNGATEFIGNVVDGNTAVWLGAGIYVDTGSGDIRDNLVSDNHSGGDGAGAYTRYSSALIADNLFRGNVSAEDAGGLRVFHGAAIVRDDTFESNVAEQGDGGGVKVSHQASEFEGNTFVGNVAGGNGGGMEIDDDTSTVKDSVFIGNTAREGGGLHVLEPYFDLEVWSSTFTANVATSCGGAIAIGDDGAAVDAWKLTVHTAYVEGNSAPDGGGLCARYGELVIQNAIVTGNVATGSGGGVYIDGVAGTFGNVVIDGNEAPIGAGVAFAAATSASVEDSVVSRNAGLGVSVRGTRPEWRYNDVWGNVEAYGGLPDPTGSDGNLADDPVFVAGFQLGPDSPCVDAGDPAGRDADGSRMDLGAFGGAGGAW
jgi:hypothetical protein